MKSVSMRHLVEHGPMLRALGRTAVAALRGAPASTRSAAAPSPVPELPGPWFHAEVKPPSAALVRAFVAATGGDPGWYRDVVPAQLFPQWTLATASRALATVPYPLARIVNAGCKLEIRGAIAAGEPLVVRARLAAIDASESRVVLTTRIETGTRSAPECLVAELRAYVPLARPKQPQRAGQGVGPRPAPPSVPAAARELARVSLGASAGLDFAKLTGDFNPIHWLAPYAKSAGFRSCVLHGFGTFALAASAVVRGQLAGNAAALRVIDARFTRPLVLPARVGVYVTDDGGLYVGDAPGGVAYLAGTCQIGDPP